MINLLLHDSDAHPELFMWSGPLSTSAVDAWQEQNALHVPADLRLLWTMKGGGGLFESETILQPFGAEEYELIGPVTQVFVRKGLNNEFCVFQTGLIESVFRKSDGAIFSKNSSDPSQMLPYRDLDEWYANTLRAAFAESYGLDALR